MKEAYEAATVQVVTFGAEDIIRTSGLDGIDDGYGDDD